ncbi:unnamed protein product [Protopolystoma xenopodis]|uniref:Uncharacterized protein n=1 Tax=Protopolystoma xenopodis TaxID=117903 RepID=A0A3S5BH00_9PLAT|nr:unnamed protein product [Protopolystoma xenopodis]
MRLPRKQRQHECSSKANRQLVKRNPLSSFGGTDLRISSPNTSTRSGSKFNNAKAFFLIERPGHLWTRQQIDDGAKVKRSEKDNSMPKISGFRQ